MADTQKRGRPSRYTRKAVEEICDRLASGQTLRSICRDECLPHESTVRMWAKNDLHGFYTQYARARDIGLDAMADDLLDIADDGTNDFVAVMGGEDDEQAPTEYNAEHVQRSRLRVDTRKWYLSKMAPKRYGDRLEVEHGVNDSLADRLMEARRRAAKVGDGR